MTEDETPPLADPASDARLEAARRQLQLLTDTVAHDLRAPLRAIDAFTGRVADSAHERLTPGEREQLQRVRDAAKRMSDLLASLGELSRAGHAPLQAGEVDLSLLADWILADLQAADPGRAARLQVQPGLVAHGDDRWLRVMLAQLLGNAWKFSAAAETTRIEVAGERTASGLRLTVRDAGIGFDPRYADKLFQPLQRLHAPEQGGGHGLGLAIAQRIAERHGGTITAVSQPGDGAAFTVHLPHA
jgi:signal transduction histidine kinase